MSLPRINLLPYRQEKRARRQREFSMMMVLAALLGAAVVFFGYMWLDDSLETQRSRNQLLKTEIAKLDEQITEIDKLREEIRLAIERKKTVEALQANRSQAVHLLDQMVRRLPEGVYLTSLKQKGNNVTVVGHAQSNAHVSALMRNIESSPWLSNPRLSETKRAEIKPDNPAAKGKAALPKGALFNEFTLIFDVKRADAEAKKPAIAQGQKQGGGAQ